jgi:hypothetical protein
MSVVGIAINGILHKARPVRQCPKCGEVFGNGVCPTCKGTAGWRQTNCGKCGSINAFVFQSVTDKYCYFIFCQRCKKYEFVRALPAPPLRYVKKVDSVPNDVVVEEPPSIGSIDKPAVKADKPKRAAKAKS